MKYLALALLFLVPTASFAATVDEQKTAIIQQLIVLIEQELDYLMSIQAGTATPTGASVDNTVAIQSLTQQLNTPTMQPEIIVHDDTQCASQWDGKPHGRYFDVFVKNDGSFSDNSTVEFWVNDELKATYTTNSKQLFDMGNPNNTEHQPGATFSYEFPENATLTVKAEGTEQVINIP